MHVGTKQCKVNVKYVRVCAKYIIAPSLVNLFMFDASGVIQRSIMITLKHTELTDRIGNLCLKEKVCLVYDVFVSHMR